MGISIRHYIFEESGVLKRVPQRISDALVSGDDAIPEYAGTKLRVAGVVLESHDAKPRRIVDVQCAFWHFDEEGRIDEGLKETLALAMDFVFSGPHAQGKVVDLVPEIKRQKFHAEHRWNITKDELDRLAADIWPAINGAAVNVQTVQGKAPKKPPMTWEGKQALAEIGGKIASISRAIDDLSERSLLGLAFEARRTADFGEDASLWSGLADECDRQRAIKARRRTGKGGWFAVIEMFVEESRRVSRASDLAYERCEGKDAAIAAARRLLAEHADKFSDKVTLEARIYSDLEWKPVDD